MSMKKLPALLLASVLLAGCATNPVTGRRQFIMVSESEAIAASKQAYAAELAPLAKQGKVDNDPAMTRRVHAITSKLIAQAIKYRPETAKWEWSVKVIDDPQTVNAFCMAGGKMAIYSGLITKLNVTDDEIANVMGHEIGHALSNHTAEKMSVAMASQLGAALAGVAAGSQYGGAVSSGAAVAATLAVQLPNSRTAESEADRIGIELAAKAGYDPNAAVTLWEKMAKAGGGRQPEFLSTHPAPETRIRDLQTLAPQMMPYYLDKSPRPVYPLRS
ncbi:MAG: M48 family metallopeptidase [Betaproteobacteria bacterium]|nr:M48 family metallopeptidase [Betaproteobacteria bacterium]